MLVTAISAAPGEAVGEAVMKSRRISPSSKGAEFKPAITQRRVWGASQLVYRIFEEAPIVDPVAT
jgi:hypothetical protein